MGREARMNPLRGYYSRFDEWSIGEHSGFYPTIGELHDRGEYFFCFFNREEQRVFDGGAHGDAIHYPDRVIATQLARRLLRPDDRFIPGSVRHLWP